MKNALKNAEQVLEEIEKLLGVLTKYRREEATAKLLFERAKENLAVTGRDVTMELASQPGFDKILDPRTGKSNKDWTQWVIDREMEKDPRYQEAITQFFDAQEKLQAAQIELIDLSEKLGAKKSEARLLSAIISLMTEDEHGEHDV